MECSHGALDNLLSPTTKCVLKKFCILQCIYLSITLFFNIYLQKMLHRFRRKLHSIKLRNLRVYIKSIDKKSAFVYTSVLWVFRNLKNTSSIRNLYEGFPKSRVILLLTNIDLRHSHLLPSVWHWT